MAKTTEQEAQYILNRGFDDQYYKDIILEYIKKYGHGTKKQFRELLITKLPDSLNDVQKERKIGNLLTAMKKLGIISIVAREGRQFVWALSDN